MRSIYCLLATDKNVKIHRGNCQCHSSMAWEDYRSHIKFIKIFVYFDHFKLVSFSHALWGKRFWRECVRFYASCHSGVIHAGVLSGLYHQLKCFMVLFRIRIMSKSSLQIQRAWSGEGRSPHSFFSMQCDKNMLEQLSYMQTANHRSDIN